MEEIQNLSTQIDFNNFIYYFNGKKAPKKFIGFKGSLGFYKNIKEAHITLKKQKKKLKEFKSEIIEIIKGGKTSEDQKTAINNIKTLFKTREKNMTLFDDYFRIVSEAIWRSQNINS